MLSDLCDAEAIFQFIMVRIADKHLIWYKSVENNKILSDLYADATYVSDFKVIFFTNSYLIFERLKGDEIEASLALHVQITNNKFSLIHSFIEITITFVWY